MSEPIYVAPTTIKTWRDCNRAVAYNKVEKIRSPSSPGQLFGTRVHDVGENWLTKRIAPAKNAAGYVFEQGIGKPNFLPDPDPRLRIEKRGGGFAVQLVELDNVFLHGYRDVVAPPGVAEEWAVVYDHKYTKDKRWIPTIDQMRSDPQALIYSAVTMLEEQVETVEARWLYYIAKGERKKPGGTAVRALLFTPATIDPYWDDIVRDANDIAEMLRTAKNAKEVGHNNAVCQKFGGCFYRNICPREGSRAAAYIAQDERLHANKERLVIIDGKGK